MSAGKIAAAAGVSRATFFNYFSTKEELVLAQDREAHRTLLTEAIEQRPSGASARTVLLAGVRRMLRHDGWPLAADDELVSVRAALLTEVPALRAAYLGQLADLQQEWTDLLASAFGAELPRTEGAALVDAMAGAITNAALVHLRDGGAPSAIPAIAEHAATIALGGRP